MPADRPVIAHVLHRLDRAGAEVLASGLARALRDDYTFVFFCLDGLGPLAEGLKDDGFVVEQLERRPGVDWALGRRLRERLKAHRVSVVHAHQYTPFFYSALARGVLLNRTTPPILFTEHGRHYPDRRSFKRVLANKLLLRHRDRVTAVGEFVREALVKNEGIARRRIEVVYNGIDPGGLPSDADRAAARQRLEIANDRPVVMQVARFHPVKDHATALCAWAHVCGRLSERETSPLLVLVGDGGEREAMQRLANTLDIEPSVLFTGPVEDARALIPAADVCMLSSLSEGVSVTLLEAMAAGKPVVATNVGGNVEVVEDHKTGLLAPRGDAEALGDCLIGLILDQKLRTRLGHTGREHLVARFTADRMHAGYARLYGSVLGFSRG